VKEIGIFEAKTKLSEICKRVEEEQATYVITRRGRPMAKITPIQDTNSKTRGSIIEDLKRFEEKNGQLSEEETDFPKVWEHRYSTQRNFLDD